MKYTGIVFILLLSFICGKANAQLMRYENLAKVSIIDPKQLYYDYMLSGSDKGEIDNLVGHDEKTMDHVLQHCTETGWPVNFNSIDWRTKTPGAITSLLAYRVGEFSGFLSLLIIPEKENNPVLKKWNVTLTNDIYIIIPTDYLKDRS